MCSQKFNKSERLKSVTSIGRLFREGKSIHHYPVRMIYEQAVDSGRRIPVKVAFAVPSRKFKSAVLRNRIKRRMKEAYRLNKSALLDTCPISVDVVFLYTGKEELSYENIERSLRKSLSHLQNAIK